MSDLEAFFRNKDIKAKNKKNKNKINTSNFIEIAQQNENRRVKKEKEKSVQQQESNISSILLDQEDDEWEDTQEPELDLEKLKLNAAKKVQEEQDQQQMEKEAKEEILSETGSVPSDSGSKLPAWSSKPKEDHDDIVPDRPIESVPARTGTYVPPGKRQELQPSLLPKKSAKKAPNIQNQEEFPTLGEMMSGAVDDVDDGQGKWSQVSAGGKHTAAPSATTTETGQKYIPPRLRNQAAQGALSSRPPVKASVREISDRASPVDRSNTTSENQPSFTNPPPSNSYVPPHIRNKNQVAGAKAIQLSTNRFASLVNADD